MHHGNSKRTDHNTTAESELHFLGSGKNRQSRDAHTCLKFRCQMKQTFTAVWKHVGATMQSMPKAIAVCLCEKGMYLQLEFQKAQITSSSIGEYGTVSPQEHSVISQAKQALRSSASRKTSLLHPRPPDSTCNDVLMASSGTD